MGVAIGFSIVNPREYQRYPQNFMLSSFNMLLQPAMELVADGKVNHAWDWSDISIPKEAIPTSSVYLDDGQAESFREFDSSKQNIVFTSMLADIGYIQRAAIMRPVDYSGTWGMVYCIPKDAEAQSELYCQESRLYSEGEIKILVDGDAIVWGQTLAGDYVEVELVEYISRDQYSYILFL